MKPVVLQHVTAILVLGMIALVSESPILVGVIVGYIGGVLVKTNGVKP